MKVLVVDEVKHSSRKLERTLRKFDNTIQIVATVPSVPESLDWLKAHGSPDVILVSKEMLRDKSPHLVSAFGLEATVIFSLENDQYHFTAFRTNNLEYLAEKQLFNADSRELATTTRSSAWHKQLLPAGMLSSTLPTRDQVYRNRFLVKQGQKFVSVEVSEIAYFFSFERFVYFKTYQDAKFLVEYSLEELAEMLDPDNFFRVNRSLLLAFKAVKHIHPYSGNRLKLHLHPVFEKEVIVSREKMHDFKSWLGE